MTRVQNYISEKFSKFAESRNITLTGTPTMCEVTILASSKGKTQHMSATAEKDGIEGFLINVADRTLRFFPMNAVICKPIRDGKLVKGKSLLRRTQNGDSYVAK